MGEQAIWGILIITYVLPFWVWQISEYSTIEGRKKLYPGSANVEQQDSRLWNRSLAWCAGLVPLLAAWKADWHPIATGIVFLGIVLLALGIRFAVRRWQLMGKRLFRLWLAGVGVWILAVGSWYLIFGRISELSQEEFFYLAFVPPLVVAVGIGAWRWARKP